jgi:hypothetical protein
LRELGLVLHHQELHASELYQSRVSPR